MAKNFLTGINLNKNQLLGARIENVGALPAAGSSVAGQLVFLTSDNTLYFFDGTGWIAAKDIPLGTGSVTSTHILDGTIVNADINASAAIARSKLDFGTGLVNADIATGAAIARSKLDFGTGLVNADIATGANIALSKLATDPLARANHTGTQLAATISDFTEAAQDAAGSAFAAGTHTGATVTYDDTGNAISVAVTNSPTVGGFTPAQLRDRSTHTGTQLSSTISDFDEAAQDAVGGMVTGNTETGITVTYNDATAKMDFVVTDSPTVAGNTPAQLRDRSTHTGTQTASTISDFDTQVRTSRLDQMAAPTADVAFNNRKITGLANPSAATDAATKGYVDNAINGVDWKSSVRVASTANIAVASGLVNGAVIDGVAVVTGDRVLLKNQTTPSENGIYVVVASGAASRATDADSSAEVTPGLAVFVEEGTANGNQQWILTTDAPITLGTTGLTFAQIGAQAAVPTAGAGLVLTGNTYDVGQGTGIIVNTDDISVDTSVVVRKYAATIVGGSTSEVITHGLGTRDVTVAVYTASGVYDEVECDIEHTSTTTVTLRWATAPAAGAYRVVIHG